LASNKDDNKINVEITNDVTYEHGQSGKIEGLLKPKLDWELTRTVQNEIPVWT
jgi:hypothetical protein